MLMDSATFWDFIKWLQALWRETEPWDFFWVIGGVVCIGAALNRLNERRKKVREREEYERIYPPKRK